MSTVLSRDPAPVKLWTISHDLPTRGVGLKVVTGQGAAIETTSAQGNLVFGIFTALAEFERELISEQTKSGFEPARTRGRKGGRPFKMTPAKVRLSMASMGQPETNVAALCQKLVISLAGSFCGRCAGHCYYGVS